MNPDNTELREKLRKKYNPKKVIKIVKPVRKDKLSTQLLSKPSLERTERTEPTKEIKRPTMKLKSTISKPPLERTETTIPKVNTVNYPIDSILQTDTSISIPPNTRLHLCLYNINKSSKLPFLEYLFFKNKQPSRPLISSTDNTNIETYQQKINDIEELIKTKKTKIYTLKKSRSFSEIKPLNREIKEHTKELNKYDRLIHDIKNKDTSKKEFMFLPYTRYSIPELSIYDNVYNKIIKYTGIEKEDITFQGYIYHNNEYYILCCADISYKPNKLERNSNWWWVTIDEIVNKKSCMNFYIEPTSTKLFTTYHQLIYLYTDDEIYNTMFKTNIIEIPTILYHGTHHIYTKNIIETGLDKCSDLCMLGNYYYFGTYRKAVRYAGWTSTYKPKYIRNKDGTNTKLGDFEGRYDKGSLIRYAVFLGNIKVLLNHPNDREDITDTYHAQIEENSWNKPYLDSVLKLHDHDGYWNKVEGYDSIYVGKAKLDNGKSYMGNPEFVVNNTDMFIPITYHDFDNSTLLRNWDNSYEYYYIK